MHNQPVRGAGAVLVPARESQGYDAAVIGCCYDLGLQESRELVRRLVVTAPCESSVLLAASLGHRFSILVGRRRWIPRCRTPCGVTA